LLNGSLDAQPVELPGIVTARAGSNTITLFLRGGVVKVELRSSGHATWPDLSTYENALVRIRVALCLPRGIMSHIR
jgi:hypothetical protein